MAQYTFLATAYRSYGARDSTYAGEYFNQGYYGLSGVAFFDSAAIRSALTGQRVTSIIATFSVYSDPNSNGSLAFIGTHNYTSIPSSVQLSRLNLDLVRQRMYSGGNYQVQLGTSVGAAFVNGTATGLIVGPIPAGFNEADERIAMNNFNSASVRTRLIITTEPASQSPNAPTLNSPANNIVVDAVTNALQFSWTHNDPNGDAQAAWRFRRRKPDASYDYWTGTTFSATATRLTQSTAPLTNGIMTIPANVWGSGTAYAWSVATEDPGGLVGPYSAERTLYASRPPSTSVTAPTGEADTSRPTLTWTYTDADSNPQYGWAAQVVPIESYTASGYNPDNYLGQAWSASGDSSQTSVACTTDLRNHKVYRAYVRTASSPLPSSALQFSPWSFSTFEVVIPPFASTVLTPQNGSITDLNAGFTMSWRNSFSGNIGTQTAFALRRIVAGGSYQYWNGSSWGTTETFLAGSSASYSFRAGEVTNGPTYTFSVRIRDDYNKQSPWSTGNAVTGSSAAQVTVLEPTGITVTSIPTVRWSMYDLENDPQQTYQVRVFTEAVYSDAAFAPATSTAVWSTPETNDPAARSVSVATDLLNNNSYRAYVRVKTGGIYSGWSYSEFRISLVGPAEPALTTIVSPEDGTVYLQVQGRNSMLGDMAARTLSGWTARAGCTVQLGAFFESSKSKSIGQVTATTASNMSAHTGTYPVTPGTRYTAGVTFVAGDGEPAATAYTSIEYIDGAGTSIGVYNGEFVSDISASRSVASFIAPPNSETARVRLTWQGGVVTDVHRFYDPVLRPSTGAEWTPGGLIPVTTISVAEELNFRIVRYGIGVPLPLENQFVTIRDDEVMSGDDQQYSVTARAVYPNAVLASSPMVAPVVRWESGWLWLSDPLRPGSGRAFAPQDLGVITRPVSQGKFRPIGRRDAVLTTGTRGLREGSFTLVTPDRESREAYLYLAETSDQLLLRIPPDQGDPVGETIYIRLEGDSPEARPFKQRTPHRIIEQSWTEQYRPLTNFEYVADDNEMMI